MPITFDLYPTVRAQLTETAQALYDRDEPAAQRWMQQISALSPQTERMIYRKLWELAGRPTHESRPELAHRHYGRVAFWNQEGRTAPLEQKIRAVEAILTDLALQRPANPNPSPQILLEGEPVQINCLYDCGFDPRFSEDGNVFLNAPSRPLSELLTTIQEVVATILFTLKAYLSFDSEERNVRQAILSCAKLDRQFSAHAYNVFVKEDNWGFSAFESAEHSFFERTSDLFKTLFPDEAHPPRLFPSELLQAVHTINKPQSTSVGDPRPLPWDNGDLDRCSSWGLFRLASNYSRNRDADRFEHTYIPHYLIVYAIKESSAELKIATRDLRSALSEITIDMSSATSLEQCKATIAPHLQRMKQCWDHYIQSHELLTEVQSVFSQTDYYAKFHEVRDWERYIPSFLKNAYREYCLNAHGNSRHFEEEAQRLGFEAMEEAYRGPFSNTRTGRLLASR